MPFQRCSYPNCPKILSRKQMDSSMLHVDVPEISLSNMIALIYFCKQHENMFYDEYGKMPIKEDSI